MDVKSISKKKLAVAVCLILICTFIAAVFVCHPHIFNLRANFKKYKSKQVPALRGKIYDRDGIVLAESHPAVSVYINPGRIADKAGSVEKLRQLTGLPQDILERKLSYDKKFVWVARQMDYSLRKELDALNISGIDYVGDQKRYYPLGKCASNVIGFCGLDTQPLEGIELSANGLLQKGMDIRLTISSKLQKAFETLLEQTSAENKISGGSIMVFNAATGEILAMARVPGFDLNRFMESTSSNFRNIFLTDVIDCPAPLASFILSAVDYEMKRTKVDPAVDYKNIIGARPDTVREQMADITENDLKRYFRQLGIAEKTAISFPGEVGGSYSLLRLRHDGSGIAMTPLQLCRFIGAVANAGSALAPQILIGQEKPVGKRIMREDTAALLKSALVLNCKKDIGGSPVAKAVTGGMALELYGYQHHFYGKAFIGFAEGNALRAPFVVYVSVVGEKTANQHSKLFHDVVELLTQLGGERKMSGSI